MAKAGLAFMREVAFFHIAAPVGGDQCPSDHKGATDRRLSRGSRPSIVVP